MSRWCYNTCYKEKITGEYSSCNSDCPIFGKCFEELAEFVLSELIQKDNINNNKDTETINVVHCKECVYAEKFSSCPEFLHCKPSNLTVPLEFYCSFGSVMGK